MNALGFYEKDARNYSELQSKFIISTASCFLLLLLTTDRLTTEFFIRVRFVADDDEVLLNVLRCQLTY